MSGAIHSCTALATKLRTAKASPWENGYIESFNARLRDELLNGEISPASRSPSLASPIITLAIAIVARWLRCINPSWPKAASNEQRAEESRRAICPENSMGWMSASYHCHECEMRVMAYLRLR
jgi:transposase InsO family protein